MRHMKQYINYFVFPFDALLFFFSFFFIIVFHSEFFSGLHDHLLQSIQLAVRHGPCIHRTMYIVQCTCWLEDCPTANSNRNLSPTFRYNSIDVDTMMMAYNLLFSFETKIGFN